LPFPLKKVTAESRVASPYPVTSLQRSYQNNPMPRFQRLIQGLQTMACGPDLARENTLCVPWKYCENLPILLFSIYRNFLNSQVMR
jgi:hypothetical protein